MKGIVLILSLLFSICSFGQNCHCDSLFLQNQKIVEENYAGWFDKVTPDNRSAYIEWTNNHYLLSQKINSDSLCAVSLQQWISFFKDKHLKIRFAAPRISQGNKPGTGVVQVLSTNLTKSVVESYLAKNKNLDPIEGIYSNSSYQLAVTKVRPAVFYATVLSTSNDNWKPGEVKLLIVKKGNRYEGTFYEGDKSGASTHNVSLVDNILDFDIVFYEKISPVSKVKRDITEYEMSKDKYAPSLIFKGEVAIWKFPSFENNSYEQTAYLLEKYKSKLETTPYWVLDLRNNSGGDYSIGLQLIEYIYTNPIVFYNAEMRMTRSNFDTWYKSFISNYYESLDSAGKLKIDARLSKMKANFDRMYNEDERPADTLRMDKVKPFPAKIALLINNNTVSSGELFTMIARQSSKVIVAGTNSGGMIDYGNVVIYKTSHPAIRIQLPTNRYLWLNSGYSVDRQGLHPEIALTGNDWIEQAIGIIKK